MNIDPRGLTVIEWTDYMAPLLAPFGPIGRLDVPERWREWALSLVGLSGLSKYDVPNPLGFDDWREWAFRFNQAVELP